MNLVRGVSAALAAGALWAATFIAPVVNAAFTPLEQANGRFLFYGALSALLLVRAGAALHGLPWLPLVWLGIAGNTGYYALMASAVGLAGVAPTALVIGLLPLTVPLAGAASERQHVGRTLARIAPPLALIAGGIALINLDHLRAAGAGPGFAAGIACAAGALALWTAFAVANARFLRRHPEIPARAWASLQGVGTLAGLPITVALQFALPGSAPSASAGQWAVFAATCVLLGFGSSWLAGTLWNVASRALPLALSGQLIVFETIFAILYALAWEWRAPRLPEVAAVALFVAGVAWAVRRLAGPRPH